MRKTLLTVVALVLLSLPSACQNIDQTVQKLRSPDVNARRQAVEETAMFGTRALPSLLAMVEKPDTEPGTLMAAKMTIERIVYQSTAPGASSERKAAEQAILARLQKPAPEHLSHFLLRLVTVVGTAQSVPTLQKLLADKNLRESARMALQQIPGKEATAALERAFTQASDPAWKSALLMAIGARRQPSSAKLVLNALKSTQPQVRMTAITVAGEFTTTDIQKALEAIVKTGSEREKEAAQHSLARVAERLRRSAAVERATALARQLYTHGTTPAVRTAGLVGLAQTGGASTANTLVKALTHTNPAIADTAYALLRETRSPDLASALVVQLQHAQGQQRLRLIDLLGYQTRSPNVVLPSLLRAFSHSDPQVKVAALSAMGRLGHPDCAASLMVALGSEQIAVRQAAIEAVPGVAVALQKQGKADVAIVLARTALERSHDRESVFQLIGVLRALGTDLRAKDIATQRGFITNWWVVGPVAIRNLMRQREFVNPEAPADLQASVNGRSWRRIELDDPLAVVDFGQLLGSYENMGAYAYTEVYSDAERTVTLRIGSDDDIVCWVNGKKVHEFIGDRGLAIDQDTVTVTLQAGWNRLLCKVLNGAGGWQMTVRITAPSGAPLSLQQK